jgi:predicted transcriptional regulator
MDGMPGFHVRLTDEELERVRALAEREGRSMQAVAHDAVVGAADRRAQLRDVMETVEEIITSQQELFDRLADE